MSIVHFSPKLLKKYPDIYQTLDDSLWTGVINYFINSKYRKAVNLKNWLADQVNHASDDFWNIADQIPEKDSYDEQVIEILKWVKNHLTYIRDTDSVWDMSEYWQTAEETLTQHKLVSSTLMTGDCEDGGVLTYVLCRLMGIPANRLVICAGDVKSSSSPSGIGGHAWLAYKPQEYPLNYVFLDWTYWYDSHSVKSRDLFAIIGKDITGYKRLNLAYYKEQSRYYNIWFAFNEQKAYSQLKRK